MKCFNCEIREAYEGSFFCGEQCVIEYVELVKISLISEVCNGIVNDILEEKEYDAKSE